MTPESHDKDGKAEEEWNASWAGTEKAQFEAMLTATPAQRLAWLEEAMSLAHASGALSYQFEGPPESRSRTDD